MSRVHLAEYGTRIEAYDRPVTDPDAVQLGSVFRAPKLGGVRGWIVQVGRHQEYYDTKGEAKSVLKDLATAALRRTAKANRTDRWISGPCASGDCYDCGARECEHDCPHTERQRFFEELGITGGEL